MVTNPRQVGNKPACVAACPLGEQGDSRSPTSGLQLMGTLSTEHVVSVPTGSDANQHLGERAVQRTERERGAGHSLVPSPWERSGG